MAAGANVVEVDLVRRGNWQAVLDPHVCPPAAVCPYRAVSRLATAPHVAHLYPMRMDRPIDALPIPLRPSDPPAALDVQRLIADVYADDRYGETIDYAAPADPPLSAADAAWADALLRTAGRRA